MSRRFATTLFEEAGIKAVEQNPFAKDARELNAALRELGPV
jgi:hypothetical protein